jgi:hypothetical protein
VCALSIFFVAKSAAAVPAPMCNEEGQSIAAPFPLSPTKNGELSAGKRCDTRDFRLDKAPPPERDQQKRVAETIERALPVTWHCTNAVGRKLPAPAAVKAHAPTGFVDSLFRPPRSV